MRSSAPKYPCGLFVSLLFELNIINVNLKIIKIINNKSNPQPIKEGTERPQRYLGAEDLISRS